MINYIFELLIDLWHGRVQLGGRRRSPLWRMVRKEYARKHPKCEATGSTKKLQVHHIKDFSTNPELELDENNLIMLTRPIHLYLAHLGSYRSINPDIVEDAKILLEKIKNRR